MADPKTEKLKAEASEKRMSNEEASKFADKQAKPSSELSKASAAFKKAVESAREAGIEVSGTYSFMDGNVSHNHVA